MSKIKFVAAGALLSVLALGGCAGGDKETVDETAINEPTYETEEDYTEDGAGEISDDNSPMENGSGEEGEKRGDDEQVIPAAQSDAEPTSAAATYIKVTGDGVNVRSGAGTGYSVLGTAEKDTLYALEGAVGGWYKTLYKNGTGYISAKYCEEVSFEKSTEENVERVIAAGCALLGVKYVYGATRYHDGNGNLYSGFTTSAFDCSSLMQYIFKVGADMNLQVNTRTQIYQGTTVKKSELKRGDLLFFTNASRCNNVGIERVGHVALYLGDGYILHTASDYAKIEKISSARWAYYIQAQRII